MQRLGYYALGIALGLMILGWVQVQKSKMKQANTPAPPAQIDPGQPGSAKQQAP